MAHGIGKKPLAMVAISLAGMIGGSLASAASASATGVTLNGIGSGFSAPAVESWVGDVLNAPYSLNISYTSADSGFALSQFADQNYDFGVSEIPYGVGSTPATSPPSFPFLYVPITAAGIAFMYNIPGLNKTLQLSSSTAYAILTGGITNWDNPSIVSENPGATLPDLTIQPVTESDSTGANYVLEQWCIDEQPSLWATFANQELTQPGGPTDGVSISATTPNSNWPGILPNGLDEASTTAVAGDIEADAGAIGAVQTEYAVEVGFDTGNPATGVASVENASGDFTQPTPVDVASGLAYDTQLPDGTAQLDFDGLGPFVYPLAMLSYLLTPTTGWDPAKGAAMSQFIDYALTLGQETSVHFGYAALGLALEQYGVDAVQSDVPGAVPPTSDEQAAYACGDLTPAEVQAGQTSPTCGPPGETPEAPYVLALPLVAGIVMVTYRGYERRRRGVKS